MPRPLKEIYLAKSVKDLRDMANIPPNSEPNQLAKSAPDIYINAWKEQKNGDEEKAYVLYTKYFKIDKYVKSSEEYKRNKKNYDNMIGWMSSSTLVRCRLEALERSLKARYQSKADEEMAKHLNQRIEQTEPRIPECSTCFEPRTRTFILLPCGHATFCQACAEHFCNSADKRCPICRTKITGKNRVFQ